MEESTRLILNLPSQPERFEHRERADYDLEQFDREFRERLYSERGREIVRDLDARKAQIRCDTERPHAD